MTNYSYVTYLTNDSYAYGVALLVESMSRVDTKYPLHVLVTDEVSAAALEILQQLHVTYERVDILPTPEAIYQHNLDYEAATAATWRNCWTQFKVFDLTQFDKIVFLDADVMIMKNLDHLFAAPHMTAALDGEYFGLWQGWPHFNTGCMVIEPSHEEYEKIMAFAYGLKVEELPEYIIANQEVLNMYYKDWPEQQHLHLGKYYNVFAPYVLDSQLDDLRPQVEFIHYVGRKPWTFWLRGPEETYAEYYYSLGKEMVEARIRTLDWEKICSKVVVSVYGICKNEIKSIKNYLESFHEADYVCLLDTGSTDGTWEYLQKAQELYPNLIIRQQTVSPWRFDRARNISLELVPPQTTMYFMADIDEVIKESGWVNKVRDSWTPLFDRSIYTYNREVGPDDVVIKQIDEYRIHSKEWPRWENIVHEALVHVSGRKQFYVETCTPIDITVWHYPTKQGQTNYMDLCEEDLKEHPDDWVMHLQLAIEYELRSEWDKAFGHFEYIINNKNTLQDFEVARCYFGIGRIYAMRGDIPNAMWYYTEGRMAGRGFVDNYLAAAEIYYNNKEYNKAIELCVAGLRNCQRAQWCGIFDAQSYYPYWLLGMSYYFLGQKDKALGYITIGYFKNPSDEMYDLKKEMAMQIAGEWRNDLSLS